MSKILCAVLVFIASTSFALTNKERSTVIGARGKLKIAQEQFAQAEQKTQEAEQKAAEADKHAQETDEANKTLEKDIKDAHEREVTNFKLAQKYKGAYDQSHKWWGIGGIIAGFGILATHILILIASLLALCLILWLLSFVPFFSWLKPAAKIASAFVTSIGNKIAALFKKKT